MGRIWVLTDTASLGQRMPRAVLDWLSGQGHPSTLVVSDGQDRLSKSSFPASPGPGGAHRPEPCDDIGAETDVWSGLTPDDLVLCRGSSPSLRLLWQRAQALGARCLEAPEALAGLDHPLSTLKALEACGLWVPTTFFANAPEDLAGVAPELFPLALTPMEGPKAKRQIVRSLAELLALDWQGGSVVAQTRAATAPVRLLIAGETVWARRLWSWTGGITRQTATRVTPELRSLAARCREALSLELLGLDIADFGEGPVVVDVEAFPDYTGTSDAPEVIGKLLVSIVGAPERPGARAALKASPSRVRRRPGL